MSRRVIPGLALLAVLLGTVLAHADEIRLKDGTKITGTIVGFEDDSFRVETPYGFALVRKDKVADINISAEKPESKKDSDSKPQPKPESKKELDSNKEPEPKPKSNPPAPVAVAPGAAKESLPPASASTELKKPAPETRSGGAGPSVAAAKGEPPPPATTVAATPPPPAAPPPAPGPPVIHDEIRGNVYANLTYGFQMYKPPSWELIPEARSALPDAVAALGTYDQTTLLVIGREHTKDSLEAHAAATGKALNGVYENYREIANKRVTIAGFPAIEQRARGTVDGRDWSVLLLTFLKSNDAYTLLGMTWADSDLIQVQENVLEKAVNSLTFGVQ